MIDERILTDATRCPSCATPLKASTTCPTCAVDLSGPTARAVWSASVQAAALLVERSRLIGELRAEVSPDHAWTASTRHAERPVCRSPIQAPGAPPGLRAIAPMPP